MYGSSLPPQGKFSPQGRKTLQRSQGKSCGYYLRIALFFSSLIQSLIIVGLVLFLVYGKPQDSASETRIRDLEGSFNRMSVSNQELRQQRTNLSRQLNATLLDKKKVVAHLAKQSMQGINFLNNNLMICERSCRSRVLPCPSCVSPVPGAGEKNLQKDLQICEKRNQLVHSNFSQTNQQLQMALDRASQERDTFHLNAINLRKTETLLTNQLEQYTRKCKEDFVQSLGGISDVSKAFLEKIDKLGPRFMPFQLSCVKQHQHLEQIQTNCSSLSREVETKFQRYLDNVGTRVSEIQAQSSRLEARNTRLEEDLRLCTDNRSSLIKEHASAMRRSQERHDQEKESILEALKIKRGEVELQKVLVDVKQVEIDNLTDRMKRLNASCPKLGGVPPSGRVGSSAWPSTSLNSNPIGSTNGGSAGLGLGTVVFGTGSIGTALDSAGTGGVGLNSRGSGGVGPAGTGSVDLSSGGRMGGASSTGPNFNQASLTQLLKDLESYTKPPV